MFHGRQEDLNLPENKKEVMRKFDDDRKWSIMQATIKEQVRTADDGSDRAANHAVPTRPHAPPHAPSPPRNS